MDKKALQNLFTGLPLWAKGILALAVIGGLILIVVKFNKTITNIQESIERKKAKEEAEKELKNLVKSGQAPSFSDTQYRVFCDKLLTAMDDWGTDEDVVYDVFGNMKNDSDILKMITIYGTREMLDQWGFNKEFNLPAALSYELTKSELNKLNNILASKSISYRF